MTPTVTGYYWARANDSSEWQIVHLRFYSGKWYCGCCSLEDDPPASWFRDWIGPLEPPIAPG